MKVLAIPLLLLLFTGYRSGAQTIDRNSFPAIDSFVSRAGALRGYSLKVIVDSITTPCTDEYGRARAIYLWIARNIGYDCFAYHHPNEASRNASYALNERKATAEGYADLVQQMCNIAHIRCETIHGEYRVFPGQLANDEALRHNWNAISINNTWFLMDAAMGAGYTDEKRRQFFPYFTDAWFFPDRQIFALSHFPDEEKWQLLEQPVSKTQYRQAPIIGPGASVLRLQPLPDIQGVLRSREDSLHRLVFRLNQPAFIRNVFASWNDTEPEPLAFYQTGPVLDVDLIIPSKGEYFMTLYVNGMPAFVFKVNAGSKRRGTASATAPAGEEGR